MRGFDDGWLQDRRIYDIELLAGAFGFCPLICSP